MQTLVSRSPDWHFVHDNPLDTEFEANYAVSPPVDEGSLSVRCLLTVYKYDDGSYGGAALTVSEEKLQGDAWDSVGGFRVMLPIAEAYHLLGLDE